MNKHGIKTYRRFGIDTTKEGLSDEDVLAIFHIIGKGNLNLNNADLVERLLCIERDYPSYNRMVRFLTDTLNSPTTSPVSPSYWVARGFSGDDAERRAQDVQRGRRRPLTLDYWLDQGYTPEDAAKQLSQTQSHRSKTAYAKRDENYRRRKTPRSLVYWTSRGYSESAAEEEVERIYAAHSASLTGRSGWVPVHKRNTRLEFYRALGLTDGEAKVALRQRQTTRTLTPEQRTAWRTYYTECWYYTNQQLTNVPEIDKRSVAYHLDHMFSIYDGFHQQVPPQIIGSVANLRIIPAQENQQKQRHSCITKEHLLHEYTRLVD